MIAKSGTNTTFLILPATCMPLKHFGMGNTVGLNIPNIISNNK